MASFSRLTAPEQCVPYARRISGVTVYGDAYTWWDRAAGHYRRGQQPEPGAVLVLARTQRMRHGHVAVVRSVIDPRQIDITHSNWGDDPASRRLVYHTMRVKDVSAANDWSRLRFWNHEISDFGLPYAARGFIYPRESAAPSS